MVHDAGRRAYYNEHDPHAAQWLRNLISAGLIAPGDVDERSIEDVRPSDLAGHVQCHFFAGVGTWSYALRRAGWPDERPVWTGSCPCFPAGTLVMTRRGQVAIEDVVVGDEVLTHLARWRHVTHVGSDWSSLVTVKGQGHFGLECTALHPFLTEAGWIPAEHLEGRRWSTIANIPQCDIPRPKFGPSGVFFDKSVNKFRVKGERDGKPIYVGVYATKAEAATARDDAIRSGLISVRGANAVDVMSLGFAKFLGYWAGDGWVSGSNVAICGAKEDEDLLRDLLRNAGMPATISIERTSSRARCGSKALAEWLTEHFGFGADKKRIPLWLHGASPEYRGAFLDGYNLADGHEERAVRGGSKLRCFTTVSRALAIGTRILLNQHGVSASIMCIAPKRQNLIEGRRVNEKPFYRVVAYERSRSFKFCGDYGRGLVRSVERSSLVRRTFNLAVDADESYIADGIVVHNCQPFSQAGKRNGFSDERHLWPAWHWLIEQLRPPTIFGEQVASKDGLAWINLVQSDLEGAGYAFAAQDLCAAGIGAPHVRQRLFFVASSDSKRCAEHALLRQGPADNFEIAGRGETGELGDAQRVGSGRDRRGRVEAQGRAAVRPVGDDSRSSSAACELEYASRDGWHEGRSEPSERGPLSGRGDGELGDASGARRALREREDLSGEGRPHEGRAAQQSSGAFAGRAGPTNGFWRDPDWLLCTDGKWRPVKSAALGMAHGPADRMAAGCADARGIEGFDLGFPLIESAAFKNGSNHPIFGGKSRAKILKGLGNAIVAPLAVELIKACI